MGLGEKLSKSINTLGRKSENSLNKLGQKTNQTFRKIDNTINRVDNVASNVIDKSANMAQNVVSKSGKVTDALRIGANIGNSIVTNLNRAGLADVPMIGTVSKLAETVSVCFGGLPRLFLILSVGTFFISSFITSNTLSPVILKPIGVGEGS